MKRLTAKVGEYQKDGQTKGRYVDLGVIMANDNGEYIMLDPSVSLAGVLAKQNSMARSKGKQERDSVMVGIFDQDSNQGGGYQQRQQPQQGYQQPQGFNQQPAQQQQPQQPAPQQGFNQPTGQPAPPPQGFDDFEDDQI